MSNVTACGRCECDVCIEAYEWESAPGRYGVGYILYVGPREPKNSGDDVLGTARGCDVLYQGLVFSEGLGSPW